MQLNLSSFQTCPCRDPPTHEFLSITQGPYILPPIPPQVVQLGLSAFLRCPATGDYTCRTFNFTVFPRLTTATAAVGAVAADTRFLCQASSLQFLASQVSVDGWGGGG